MAAEKVRSLRLTYHGRILDHLGIQMYQSPVAALAEMVSNAWDADAERVAIQLPLSLGDNAAIVISDDGLGMTFNECQERYLNVGYARRGDDADESSPEKSRPILGRKGIGKFAGFGIAKRIEVETISKANGEKTTFEMDLEALRQQEYVETDGGEVNLIAYQPPAIKRKQQHGTKVTLKDLTLSRIIAVARFRLSMSRRFLLHKRASDFDAIVNGESIPDEDELANVEFSFPTDYEADERPDELIIEDGWGVEKITEKHVIRWRIVFQKDPIDDEELRGIAVFSGQKLAQAPFFFNLAGGLGGQHGQEYITGQVEADYIDRMERDVIATERQRVDWEHIESRPLLLWGQSRIKSLLRMWKSRRAEEKIRILNDRVSQFGDRLSRLESHERKTIKRALTKLAGISTLKDDEFVELGSAILTAWEGGRLRELISTVADAEEMSEETLLAALLEMNVITALHTAEAVKAKLNVIAGLNERIRNRELENAVRDYIAKNPWLINPEWETFAKETRVNNLLSEAAEEAKLNQDEDWDRRIDLVLSSGSTLLIVEFMRPGLAVDYDHVNRFDFYINAIRARLDALTAIPFDRVIGYLVADKLNKSATITKKLEELRPTGKFALDWPTLLQLAAAKWREFLTVLVERAPADDRLRRLAEDLGGSLAHTKTKTIRKKTSKKNVTKKSTKKKGVRKKTRR